MLLNHTMHFLCCASHSLTLDLVLQLTSITETLIHVKIAMYISELNYEGSPNYESVKELEQINKDIVTKNNNHNVIFVIQFFYFFSFRYRVFRGDPVVLSFAFRYVYSLLQCLIYMCIISSQQIN